MNWKGAVNGALLLAWDWVAGNPKEVGISGDAVNTALKQTVKNEGATQIASITVTNSSQSTASIQEKSIEVTNDTNATIFVRTGVGAVAVVDQSTSLLQGQSKTFGKTAGAEVAVIGPVGVSGKAHFSPVAD